MRQHIASIVQTLGALPWERMEQVLEVLHDARLRRATIFVCGNGGSAATAAHWVNDLNKGANAPGVPRFRAVGLVDNVPLLTAWSNDVSYAEAFAEPLRNLVRPGDLLIAISGSGNSPNVLNAVRVARDLGALTIGFTGGQGGQLGQLADVAVLVPNPVMEQIEDVHLILEHALIAALRERAQREQVPSLLLADGTGATPRRTGPRAAWPARGALFLDRDGVVNANRADHVKSWEEFELLPGALGALRALAATPWPIVVITNQSAINRQLLRFEMAESMARRLMAQVAAEGGRLDAVAWCPHAPEEKCACRKPATGMLTYAAEVLHLDLARSYLLGDAASDIAAGMAVGCRTCLVLTGRGAEQRAEVMARWGGACQMEPDLAAAARWLLAQWAAHGGG